jgi:exopolysaccharide production protein ExoQ
MTWRDAGDVTFDDPWRAPPRPANHGAMARAPSLRLALNVDVDGCFAFLLFLAMLFAAQLGTVGAAILMSLIPLYAVLQRRRLWAVLAPRAVLFVAPLLALLSVFWSEAPGPSAKLAVEYAATVLGALLLAGARNPHAVLRGMFLAFIPYLVVSLAFGHSTAVGNDGTYAFSGLTNGKNLLGDIAASGALVSVGVLVTSIQRRKVAWALAAVVGIGLAAVTLVVSRSAGALLGLSFGLLAMGGLLAVYRANVPLRAVLFGFLTLCLGLGIVFHRWLAAAMLQLGAEIFDKDTTLTGRTYLWYRAQDLIHEAPLLGRGFHAFWLQGNIDAEGLWRYAGITSRGGFTFHNTLVEILVQLGWVGAIALGAAGLVALWFLVLRCVKGPTLSLCVWTAVLFYMLVRTPIETIGLAPLYFSTVLLFMALGFALGRRGEGAPRKPVQPAGPQPVRVVAVRVLEPGAQTQAYPRQLLPPPSRDAS